MSPRAPPEPQRLLPRLQRQRHHRQHGRAGDAGGARLTDDFEVIVVNDGSRDKTAAILRRTRDDLSAPAGRHSPGNRGYGGALQTGFALVDEGPDLLHRRRRAVRPGARWRCSGRRMRDDVDWVNGYKISRSDPLHRIVIGRIYHHIGEAAVRPQGARRGLRFPARAAVGLRPRAAREDQRRHLPRDDEEVPRRRLPRRRGAGAPLSPRVRQVAVLQLPPARQDRASTSLQAVGRRSSIQRQHLRGSRDEAPSTRATPMSRRRTATSIAAAG